MGIRTYISIITLNINGLNAPTKRPGLAEWIQNQDSYMLYTRDSIQTEEHIQIENEEMKEVFHANRNQNKTGVIILISDKIDFKRLL